MEATITSSIIDMMDKIAKQYLIDAVEKGDGTLDKEATSHDDLLDAFRMSLQFWH